MAIRTDDVTEKLLECAKEEFLENGYENASLRTIAAKAGSSKGSIYFRFTDKESLYRELVQPVVDGFCGLLGMMLGEFEAMSGTEQKERAISYADGGFPQIVDYIYEHFDMFRLLMMSGENKAAQELMHRIVEIDVACTMQFIEQTGNDAVSSGRLTADLAHLLSSAFYSGVFEVVVHDMPQEQANIHIQRMRLFYNAGWKSILEGTGGDIS
ncbi:TetR/AcrR family transcriptional regulator [Faecalicatena contorta]|uniref:DNA-binding transcriptional regulator, AcrR family n=1 Tax=Faecalicatena contorta TaxID=39482 RepID=A0A315ZP94_9FIRM|nr:TetR/AcrR family transcriptional regulator [Faecalicatena contorta]PWJ47316.1 TetR family transcriptional regulator [Faecalicatena contorta]SUQ16030.1 DNA-binding transcriptional regulator, AcrR family [Faecalicatena contorta]